MSTTFQSATPATPPAGFKAAADRIGTGTPPVAGDDVQYVKLDIGAAGSSSPVVGTLPVSDGAGSLTVDAPVGTPVFTRLSDGTAALIAQKVMASSLPVAIASDQSSLPVTNTNLDVALSTRLKPADTLAGVTTVGAVTAITNALPAGTNLIGKVQEGQVGRAAVNMTAEAVAGIIAETAITMSVSKANGTVATGTSFTPTAGKNLRIMSIVISWVSTSTTANTARLRIRINPSGAATTTSAIQYSARIAWESATFIANEGEFQQISFAEGLEVPNTGGIMFTIACVAANGTLDVSAVGYEYTP